MERSKRRKGAKADASGTYQVCTQQVSSGVSMDEPMICAKDGGGLQTGGGGKKEDSYAIDSGGSTTSAVTTTSTAASTGHETLGMLRKPCSMFTQLLPLRRTKLRSD
eukprot:GHVU01114472.1.p2 GENE.GHVU01114472.1~~GHVU01114472.1.p2  ORF type:complete len:107 (-),score=13.34 GHVU01114472.1:606-926(-)